MDKRIILFAIIAGFVLTTGAPTLAQPNPGEEIAHGVMHGIEGRDHHRRRHHDDDRDRDRDRDRDHDRHRHGDRDWGHDRHHEGDRDHNRRHERDAD